MENPYQPPSSCAESSLPLASELAGLKNPRLLGLAAVSCLALATLQQVGDHLGRVLASGVALADLHLHDTYYVVVDSPGVIAWLGVGVSIAANVFYFLWLYRVAANAWLTKPEEMKMSPAMSVGCHFIPIANIVMPYQAMAGIARASCGTAAGVALWWTCWLVLIVASMAFPFLPLASGGVQGVSAFEHLYLLGSIFTFIVSWRLVMKVTRAQTARCSQAI